LYQTIVTLSVRDPAQHGNVVGELAELIVVDLRAKGVGVCSDFSSHGRALIPTPDMDPSCSRASAGKTNGKPADCILLGRSWHFDPAHHAAAVERRAGDAPDGRLRRPIRLEIHSAAVAADCYTVDPARFARPGARATPLADYHRR